MFVCECVCESVYFIGPANSLGGVIETLFASVRAFVCAFVGEVMRLTLCVCECVCVDARVRMCVSVCVFVSISPCVRVCRG